MAQPLGLSRPTVDASRRRARPPRPRSPPRSGQVWRPSTSDGIQRWRAGGTARRPRWRELRAPGSASASRTGSRLVTRRRRARAAGWAPETQTSPSTRPPGPSARAVAFTWGCPAAQRSPDAPLLGAPWPQEDPPSAQASPLRQALRALGRARRGHALEVWITATAASGMAALARFAQGLREARAAVTAGRTLPGSQGPVEGHGHRLKRRKRQG
jgi:hypothetical protein